MARERREEVHEVQTGEVPVGAKGGAYAARAYPAAPGYVATEPAEEGWFLKDRIRWSSVWSGFVIAMGVQVLLSAIGVAILVGSMGRGAGTPLGIWMAASAIISLFLGGLATARFAGIAGTMNGIWNGVVLWGLSVLLTLIATASGTTGLAGLAVRSMGVPTATLGPGRVQSMLNATSRDAGWLAIGIFVALVAAIIGGAVGARRVVATEDETVR